MLWVRLSAISSDILKLAQTTNDPFASRPFFFWSLVSGDTTHGCLSTAINLQVMRHDGGMQKEDGLAQCAG